MRFRWSCQAWGASKCIFRSLTYQVGVRLLLFENLSLQSHVQLLPLEKPQQPQTDFSISLEGPEATGYLRTN